MAGRVAPLRGHRPDRHVTTSLRQIGLTAMRETFSLGRVSGIRIGVNWSVLLIVALLAYGLAAGQFPAEAPHRPVAEYIVAAIITAVAYIGSLLAHELAHSLVARCNGVRVDGITLWLLGGVSRLQGEFPDPGAELRVAGAGPLTSLVLGGVFWLLAWGLHEAGVQGVVVAALAWLGVINILLAVFNVIPAAPAGWRASAAGDLVGYHQGQTQGGDVVRPVRAGVRVGLHRDRGLSRAGPTRLQLAVVHSSRLVPDQRGDRGEPAGGGAVPVADGGRAADHDRRPGHRAGVGHGRPVPE